MVNKQVAAPALFQDSWLSYCGAVAGVFTALGSPRDPVDIAGYAGLAFLINVAESWTDPGSATLHSGNVARTSDDIVALWRGFSQGLDGLGAQLDHYWDPEQYRFWKELPADQRARAQRLYDRVRQSIDAGRPVVVWGLFVPEYGIANGYDDDHYHVSTFRRHIGQPDEPVRWDSLQAKGGLEAVFFEPSPASGVPDDRTALARALKLARGEVGPFEFDTPGHPIREHQRYITGPAAYDEWARTLDAGVKGTLYYEYNSYNVACLHAARQAAAEFLDRLTQRHARQPQAEALARAAVGYHAVAATLQGLTQLCPYADTGDLTPAQCRQGAEQLRAARPLEESAIPHLEAALQQWAYTPPADAGQLASPAPHP
jgi:hypothetical protein